MKDDHEINYKELHGPDRVRAYNRLRYRKKVLEKGYIPKRPNALVSLKADIEKLKSKTTEDEVKDLINSRDENYAHVMRDTLLKLEPNLDQVIELMNEENSKLLIRMLKEKAHELILKEYAQA